ncbi:MAG: hypothetical protein OXU20_05370 [Myxococcales bacterium]|nr:hypothetical protein [Myxococcales bacterium]MDD9968664.1 hypothetical protein [Myxococcales bacterium]
MATACGGDEEKDQGTPRSTGDMAPDASVDAHMPDRTREPFDAGPPPEGFERQPCAVHDDKRFELAVNEEPPDVAPLAVWPATSRFGFAFVDRSETCVDALYVAELRGGYGNDGPEIATAVDTCSQIERVALASSKAGWLLASVDNREPPSDIWVQRFDPEAEEPGEGHRASEESAQEGSLALAFFEDDAALLAWVARDARSGKQRLLARVLDATGEPQGDPVVLDAGERWFFTLPTLSRVGPYMGLAYHRFDVEGASQAVLELLDPATGERARPTRVLAEDAGPEPTVALATDDEGGAVLYSRTGGVNGRQLWFQHLDDKGEPAETTTGSAVRGASEPQRIVNAPFRAIDGSIARLPTGYAVVYRALPGGDVESPRIKLQFLDPAGRTFGDSEVADTTPTGGRTSVVFSIEGRMVVGWSDRSDSEQTHVQFARIPCVGG